MRKYIRVILLVVLCFTWSCRQEKHPKPIVIVLKGPTALGLVYLADTLNNPFEYKLYDDPQMVKAALIRGEGTFFALPMNMAAILYNKGVGISVISVPVWGNIWLAGYDSIKTIADLKNKRVYISGKGTTPDIVFQLILKKNGLEPGDDVFLDYTYSLHQALAQAIVAQKVSLAVVPEPFLSFIHSKQPFFKPIKDIEQEWKLINPDSVPFTQSAMVVRKSEMVTQRLIDLFNKRARQSVEKVISNPSQAAAMAVRYGIVADSVATVQSIAQCGLRYVQADSIEDGIVNYLKVFYNFDEQSIGGKLPDEGFIYKNNRP